MSKILGCIILLYLILGVGLAEASPIFLTCVGKRSAFSKLSQPPDEEKDVTASVTIDPDAQTFAWSEMWPSAMWPHCKTSMEEKYCTMAISTELLFNFAIFDRVANQHVQGTIDRVTGELKAGQFRCDKSQGCPAAEHPYDGHTGWHMTCLPAIQRF
jgi:hypothetical protein